MSATGTAIYFFGNFLVCGEHENPKFFFSAMGHVQIFLGKARSLQFAEVKIILHSVSFHEKKVQFSGLSEFDDFFLHET